PERPAAGDLLQHDPAPSLPVALAQQAQRGLDAFGRFLRSLSQLFRRERRRGHHEQRLDDPGQRVERVGGDQAERTFHERLLSTSARAILIGAKGAAWPMAISPCLRSSSSARNATVISTRDMPSISESKSNTRRRES